MPSDRPAEGAGSPLDRLCDLLGVQRRYRASGVVHRAPDASVAATLRALGAPLAGDDPGAAAEALRAVRAERAQRLVEPVTVAWEGSPAELLVGVDGAGREDPVELRLVLEDGTVAERRVEPDELVRDAVGEGPPRARVPVADRLPLGHHDVVVRVGGREATTRLVRAPRTSWDGPAEEGSGRSGWRSWGLFLPLHALRTARDRGVGDLSDLAELARRTRRLGGDFVGTLPLLPTFVETPDGRGPHDPSPYAPVSRLFWNELYLDLERLPGLERAPEARRVLESADHRAEAARLRGTERVDYAAVLRHKRRVLEPLAGALAGTAGGEGPWEPLEAFLRERPETWEYARFRARAGEREAPGPGSARSPAGSVGGAPDPATAYHLYVQWAMAEQMDGLSELEGADLYLDLPLGCHRQGYDVRRYDVFASGASGGAPPDAFFAGGQDWGFPPLHPRRSREDGHAYVVRSLRHLMGACGMLRLDHVMSLHRLFWIPEGGAPSDGVYVRYPHEELWALLCLESRRHRCEVVGEDLGTVPPEVPAAMERHGARRMWVLPFEAGPLTSAAAGAGKEVGGAADEDARPRGAPARFDPPSPRSVASLNTHDMPPFAGFWRADDVDRRIADSQLDPGRAEAEREERTAWREAVAGLVGAAPDAGPEEVLPRALELLGGSAARLVLVNLEDLWHETRPQNVPGTAGDHNWTLRARRTLDELADDPEVVAVLERLHRHRLSADAEDGPEGRGEGREPSR